MDGSIDLAKLVIEPVADGTTPTTVAQALANMQAQMDGVTANFGGAVDDAVADYFTANPSGVSSVDGQTGAVSLTSTYGRVSAFPRARGAVCFTWDDGYPSWATTIEPLANALGQRHTFCVTTNRINTAPFGMTSADIARWYANGHEIVSHTVTHSRMGDLTTEQRTPEFDDSKSALEAIVGAGNVTTFSYPSGTSGGARTPASDLEAAGRYDRVLDTDGPSTRYPIEARSPFLISRYGWGASSHASILELIRYAATHPVIVVIYGHSLPVEVGMGPGLIPADMPSLVQIQEAMNLAHDLAVPCLTTAEAFPSSNMVMNGSFETGDTGGWLTQVAAGNLMEVITATPDTGFTGSKVLYMATTSNNTSATAVGQFFPVTPGKSYVFSGRIKLINAPLTGSSR